MTIRVEIVDGPSTSELRRAVLRPELPVGTPMTGLAPDDALYLGAFDDDATVLGTCVIFPAPYPERPGEPQAWQLRGMATAATRQGSGVGSAVLAAADAEVLKRGGRLLWCNARITAIPFYERNGWTAVGPVFVTEATGLPHRRMWRDPREPSAPAIASQ